MCVETNVTLLLANGNILTRLKIKQKEEEKNKSRTYKAFGVLAPMSLFPSLLNGIHCDFQS